MIADRRGTLRGRFSIYSTALFVSIIAAAPLVGYLWLAEGTQQLFARPQLAPALMVAVSYLCFTRFGVRLTIGECHMNFVASELPLIVGLVLLPPGTHLIIRLLAHGLGTMWRVHRNPAVSTIKAGCSNALDGFVDVAVMSSALLAFNWSGRFDVVGLLVLGLAWVVYVVSNQIRLFLSRYVAGITITRESVRSSLVNGVELSLATLAFGVLLLMGHSLTQGVVAIGIVLLVSRPVRTMMAQLVVSDQYRALDQFFTLLQRTNSSNIEAALALVSEATKCREVELVIVEREGVDCSLDRALIVGGGSRRTVALTDLVPEWRGVLESQTVSMSRRDWLAHAIVCPLTVSGSTVGLLICSEPFDAVRGITAMTQATASRLAQNLSLWLEQDRLLNELRRDMAERTHQAIHDPLTGLLNRRGLSEAWNKSATEGEGVAVFLIDLDNFKEVNSFVGHDGGDRVLIEAAERLRRALPARAHLARIGGDEFAAFLPGVRRVDGKDCSDAGQIGVRLRSALSSPHQIDGNDVSLAGSIGIAVLPQHGTDLGVLLRKADAALFAAKDDAESGVAVFADATYGHDPRDIMIDGYRLKAAIDNGDIHVYFQPVVDMHTFKVTGFEALARWNEGGTIVMPQQFIALAEKTGHIHALTERVMCEAFAQVARWRELTGRDLNIGVNLSPATISNPGTYDALTRALTRTGLEPSAVYLEVTESRMFKDPGRATTHLNHLRTTGVNISLDDFGTGASTHEWLLRMAPNQIKIDRMFIKDVVDDERAAGIVELDVQTGLKFQASVVAEGIETAEHWHKAKALGVPLAQGFLISRPKPANEIMDWLTHEEPQLEDLIALADSLSQTSSDIRIRD